MSACISDAVNETEQTCVPSDDNDMALNNDDDQCTCTSITY